MGTPSFRSSSYQESDFGSLKTFELGGESTSLKNFGDNKLLSDFSCRTSSYMGARSSSDWKDNGTSNMNGGIEGFVMSGIDVFGISDVDDNSGNEGVNMNIGVQNCEEGTKIPGKSRDVEGVKGCCRRTMEGGDEGEGLEILGGKDRKLSEGEALSGHDHSEGDDSMFGFGSDDGGEIDSYYGKNVLFHVDDSGKNEDGNSFATSSFTDMNMSDITVKKSTFSFDKVEDHFEPVKTRDFELKDFYDEIVNDMEDILLDSGDTPVARYTQGSRMYEANFSQSSRDGGSSASTSGTDYVNNWIQQPLKIDNVEVVGAKQIEGDVSLSERLLGVKKYTVYKIRVWGGGECWEVECRYRDFSTLHQRLKKQFAVQGWTLPSPWSHVDRKSRKLFSSASPNVIAERSVLIQECLQSVVAPKFTSSSFSALLCFLSQSEAVPDSPANNTNVPQTPFPSRGTHIENLTTLGKTISLNVQIRPFRSIKQMLDAQHYRCSGCHRNFDDGRTRVQEYFQVLGWGKPRLCEYSGQLFCSSCHNNDTAILPAKVLHYWDFTRYPVSQMAKLYLDSIYGQPMLCVSAVNPFLYSKVPALQHVANIRNRIAAMLPYVRCPFRRSVDKGLGSRRYILDSNDFFALRDLIDLSKGIFSALPVMVETVSRKVHEHITEQCLVCYDVGVPCNARQACNNPVSLIFPFLEEEIKKCRSCELVFHKNCFKTIVSCPCGAHFKQEGLKRSAVEGTHVAKSNLNLLGETTESGNGFISGLFSKLTPKISQNLGKNEPKDADNVILMGSLTNGSL